MDDRFFVIQQVLWEINIPPNYLGSYYLAYAELLVLENQSRLTLVTKWLYPEVAFHYQTTWKAVERNIRTAISICWGQDAGEHLRQLTGRDIPHKPSPTQMLQLLARYLLNQPEEFWQTKPAVYLQGKPAVRS